MITNQEFADSVIAALREHLASDDVAFFGSHRTGEADEYSDVDIRARIDRPLDEDFFASLTACMRKLLTILNAMAKSGQRWTPRVN